MKEYKSRKWIPLVFLIIGVMAVIVHLVLNARIYIQSALVPVEYPKSCHCAIFDSLLRQCVRDDLVDYRKLSLSPQLVRATTVLARTSPERMASDREKLAFWINAYNLLVLKAIADRYPITSTRKLGNTISAERFIVGGKPYSIEEIYLTRVYPLVKNVDSRAIFLACGGALGYPPLLDRALTSSGMQRDMELAAYNFVNDPRNSSWDSGSKTFAISAWFQWNRDLFDYPYGSPHDFVLQILDPEKHPEVDHEIYLQDMTIMRTYMGSFDWRLNDTAQKVIQK